MSGTQTEQKKRHHCDQVLRAARMVAAGEWTHMQAANHREYHLRRIEELESREGPHG